MTYAEWLKEVQSAVEQLQIWNDVVEAADGEKSIEQMRGDEAMYCFNMGDTPQEYVNFLELEWDLYGPEGE